MNARQLTRHNPLRHDERAWQRMVRKYHRDSKAALKKYFDLLREEVRIKK